MSTTFRRKMDSADWPLQSKPLNWITINLVDNGVERCRWSGVWPKDKPQGMNCNLGFVAWFQLGTAYGDTGVMAYNTGNGKVNWTESCGEDGADLR